MLSIGIRIQEVLLGPRPEIEGIVVAGDPSIAGEAGIGSCGIIKSHL